MTLTTLQQPATPPKTPGPRMTQLMRKAAAHDLTETVLPPAPVSRRPSALRRLQLISAGVMVVVGGLTALGSGQIIAGLVSSPDPTTSYAQLASIRTDALTAGNVVARAQLGAKDATSAQVNASLNHAGEMVLASAAADPASRPQLVTVNRELTSYGQQLQLALSANNPRAARVALAAADAIYDQQLDPELTAVEKSARSLSSPPASTWWFWLSLVLQIGGASALVWASVATARLTHRYVNLGLVAGLVGMATMAITTGVISGAATDATDAQHSSTLTQVYNVERAQRLAADTDRLQLRATLKRSWPNTTRNTVATLIAETRNLGSTAGAAALGDQLASLTEQQDALAARLDSAQWTFATQTFITPRSGLNTDLAATNQAAQATITTITKATGPQRQATTIGLVLVTVLQGLVAAAGALAIGWSFDRRLREYR